MGFHTYLGTHSGVFRFDDDGLAPLGMQGERVSAIHAFKNGNGRDTILAGTYGNGLYRSDDAGKTWEQVTEGMTAPAFRTITPDPTMPGAILAGTEPARAFRSEDGGCSWTELDAITGIPSCDDWYLPYSPRAGALRNFYSPPGQDERLLGSVEVGGLLNSDDRGQTWNLLDIPPDDDIHFVTGHPEKGDVLFAALGWASLQRDRPREADPPLGGVARSDDSGKSWRKFFSDYTRAVIVPSADTSLLLAGPAPRVGAQGRIEVSNDGGESWSDASRGISTPMDDMVEVFVEAPDRRIWGICSQGRLLGSDPGDWRWEAIVDPASTDVAVEAVSFVSG